MLDLKTRPLPATSPFFPAVDALHATPISFPTRAPIQLLCMVATNSSQLTQKASPLTSRWGKLWVKFMLRSQTELDSS